MDKNIYNSYINKYFEYELQQVREKINNYANTGVITVDEVLQYTVSSSGKQIRPILTIIFYKLFCNKHNQSLIQAAATIETVHLATLLHDDVIDENDFRRSKKTVNACWSNKISILSGDYLLSIAFMMLANCENLEIIQVLTEATSKLVLGEFQQMENNISPDITMEKYLDTITKKTAYLFGAACKIGVILAGVEPDKKDLAHKFGINLGIAFQMIDDLLDYTGNSDFKKAVGNDFFEQKITLPIIILMEKCTPAEHTEIIHNFTNDNVNKEYLSQLQKYLAKYNIKHLVQEHAKYYIDTSSDIINKLTPSSQITECLQTILYSMLHRVS